MLDNVRYSGKHTPLPRMKLQELDLFCNLKQPKRNGQIILNSGFKTLGNKKS